MGGGTGTDLNGIYTQATAYVAPIAPTMAGNMTKIDVIRLAICCRPTSPSIRRPASCCTRATGPTSN
jgi:hypothetical protein